MIEIRHRRVEGYEELEVESTNTWLTEDECYKQLDLLLNICWMITPTDEIKHAIELIQDRIKQYDRTT